MADGAVLAELAGLVNLPDGSNENIEGLGKPTVLTLVKPTAGDLTDPVELGKAIIAQLTIARASHLLHHSRQSGTARP
ncbi:major capsid protein [Klebsiella phage ChM-G5]|nr:major capsid protein [Klebsiella phage ChM-G5]